MNKSSSAQIEPRWPYGGHVRVLQPAVRVRSMATAAKTRPSVIAADGMVLAAGCLAFNLRWQSETSNTFQEIKYSDLRGELEFSD